LIALLVNYVTVVEDIPILSVSSSLPLLAITYHLAVRSLCDSWATSDEILCSCHGQGKRHKCWFSRTTTLLPGFFVAL